MLALPAALIGVVCSLALWAIDEISSLLEHQIWSVLPRAIGSDPGSGWWIFLVLTVVGILVGLVLWLMPGHGGQDSATVELIAPPPALRVLPSLVIVTVLALAGGVSLGPESPIIAINTGILAALFAKIWPRIPVDLIVIIAAAGTIGALFGTPVAAALVFTGVVGGLKMQGALWDRLFLPLVAAGTGAITMSVIAHPMLSVPVPAYTAVAPIDLLSAAVIACVAAVLGASAAFLLPFVHRGFRLLRNPLFYATAGGVILGILGAIGGPITLFKGLSQMGTLIAHRADYAAWTLVLIVVVKIIALLVSAAAGFRGGRIFPSVFIGAAVGVLANALVPSIPPAVAIAAGVLGVVLAVSRDGWIALFVAVAVTGSIAVLPVLCIAVLPAWLLVSAAPEMIVHAEPQTKTTDDVSRAEEGSS